MEESQAAGRSSRLKSTAERDSLSTELVYYVGLLEDTLPALSRQADRRRLVPWLRKLFSPELQLPRLRGKRNRASGAQYEVEVTTLEFPGVTPAECQSGSTGPKYTRWTPGGLRQASQSGLTGLNHTRRAPGVKYLFHLVLVTFNDKVFGVFKEPPKAGALPEVSKLQSPDPPSAARWEADRYWQALLHGMTGKDCLMTCWSHEHCSENEEGGSRHEVAGQLLDQEFRFFLYLARPLVVLLPDPEDRGTAALWVSTLAKVRPTACLTMKAIRNDYIQALLGYLQDLRLVGPFCNKPPENGQTLPPLEYLLRAMKKSAPYRPVTDPSSQDAELFLSEQPVPESGAFCYIAVTGRAQLPEAVSSVPLSTTKDHSYFANI